MTAPRREHPVANAGFPGAAFAVLLLVLGVGGCWPMLVWHKPNPSGGPFTPDVTAWIVCGVWWGLLALGALAWAMGRSKPSPKGKRP